MTASSPVRTRRAWLRPLLVVAGVAVAVAGIGGTTGVVIGSAVSPPTGYHRHHEWHDRFDQGRPGPALPPGPAPAAPARPAAPGPP